MIYDLSNEYGGVILSDSDTLAPALTLNSNAAGQPALAILSTVSGSPMIVRTVQAGNASITSVGALIQSTSATARAVTFGRTVVGSQTIASTFLTHPSLASAPVFGFGGGFISVTSILGFAATGAAIAFDYILPIELNGVVRGIPLTSLLSLVGPATF